MITQSVRVKESTVFARKYCTEVTSLSTLSVYETAEGKAEYAAAQRAFARRGAAVRTRLLDVVDAVERGYVPQNVV